MNQELLMSGVELMLLGMGIVFVFLTILVFTLHGMTWLSNQFNQQSSEHVAEEPLQAKTVTNTHAVSATHLAVIREAIARYRAARA